MGWWNTNRQKQYPSSIKKIHILHPVIIYEERKYTQWEESKNSCFVLLLILIKVSTLLTSLGFGDSKGKSNTNCNITIMSKMLSVTERNKYGLIVTKSVRHSGDNFMTRDTYSWKLLLQWCYHSALEGDYKVTFLFLQVLRIWPSTTKISVPKVYIPVCLHHQVSPRGVPSISSWCDSHLRHLGNRWQQT